MENLTQFKPAITIADAKKKIVNAKRSEKTNWKNYDVLIYNELANRANVYEMGGELLVIEKNGKEFFVPCNIAKCQPEQDNA